MAISRGPEPRMSLSEVGNWRQTAMMPWGVTVSDEFHVDARGLRRASDLRVAVERGGSGEQLDDELRPEGEGLLHGLRALEEEEAGVEAPRTLGELGDTSDSRRTGVV
jgi:hypothetical protein